VTAGRILLVLAAMVLIVQFGPQAWSALAAGASSMTNPGTARPGIGPASPNPSSPNPASPDQAGSDAPAGPSWLDDSGALKASSEEDAVYGTDYSYLNAKTDGQPLAWPCDQPIEVNLIGLYPPGAEEALNVAVTTVVRYSGLPLVVGPDLSEENTARSGAIVVYYRPAGTVVLGRQIDPASTINGLGGTSNSLDSVRRGFVLIRDDPRLDPTTAYGQGVLTHELMHAIGAGHADEASAGHELMAPGLMPGEDPFLGPGDRAVLRQLGCQVAS
jgi:hypothetical protein